MKTVTQTHGYFPVMYTNGMYRAGSFISCVNYRYL